MSESESSKKSPYASFGRRLRALREHAKETVEDLSGAVEISTDELTKLEQGAIKPTEDVLELIVSHYKLPDPEEDKLWELAGYKGDDMLPHLENMQGMASIMIMPIDGRIVYSDMAQVTTNNHGLVVEFLQTAGNKQPMAISRIGMSHEHAKSVVELLQKTLASKQPKFLPKPNSDEKTKD